MPAFKFKNALQTLTGIEKNSAIACNTPLKLIKTLEVIAGEFPKTALMLLKKIG
jgi:hypothetical protein